MTNQLNCNIVESELERHTRNYVHFRSNNIRRVIKLITSSAIG